MDASGERYMHRNDRSIKFFFFVVVVFFGKICLTLNAMAI